MQRHRQQALVGTAEFREVVEVRPAVEDLHRGGGNRFRRRD
jgi:hypothetical protein